jgi:hypothetical protein
MRSFHLQSGEEITESLPEAEIVRRLAAGELTPQHPCRLAEEEAWRTVGDFFPTGSGLKVRTKKAPAGAVEQISESHRIDDLTRRRLLAYGLADAVNIDGFTQTQAVKAIVRKERELRRDRLVHRFVQIGAFLALLTVGVVLGATANSVSLSIERSAALLQHQDGNAKANYSVLRSTLRDRAYMIERERQQKGFSPRPAGK